MNDLPTIERSLASVLAGSGYVDCAFAAVETGTLSVDANTAGASVTLLGDGKSVRVTPAGPTNYGHVDVSLTAAGEVGRARVIFLIPVTFA